MLLFVLTLAAAQAEPPPTPQIAALEAEATRVGGVWMTCLTTAVDAADERTRAEAVADAAIAGCRVQQEAMVAAADRFFESGLTGSRLARMKKQARDQVAGVRRQLIAMVRNQRR
jgi:hypothetical protein